MEREEHTVVVWCGRLLFFAALLLGVVTMHTFGHAAHAAEAARAAHTVVASTGFHDSSASLARPHVAERMAPDMHQLPGRGTGFPMDPLSVCLAVLGFGATALALLLAPRATGDRAVVAFDPAGLLRARRPSPQSGGRLLHRLSVLRV